jgi:hypothetical protein
MVHITKQVIITLSERKLRVCGSYKNSGRVNKIKKYKADENNSLMK